jgi:hypothetical protein
VVTDNFKVVTGWNNVRHKKPRTGHLYMYNGLMVLNKPAASIFRKQEELW